MYLMVLQLTMILVVLAKGVVKQRAGCCIGWVHRMQMLDVLFYRPRGQPTFCLNVR